MFLKRCLTEFQAPRVTSSQEVVDKWKAELETPKINNKVKKPFISQSIDKKHRHRNKGEVKSQR